MSSGPSQPLGEWVLDQRTKLGWSRRELARQSGLSEGKVWRIEHKGVASSDELEALQSVLPADDSVVPISPIRPVRTQQVAPPSTVGSIEQPLKLDVLQGVLGPTPTDVEYESLECGHTTREHTADALCPRHPRNDDVRLISNSELATFKRCRRKWWLAWYLKLRPTVESPTGALAIGQRIHRALREWYVPEGERRVNPCDALELFVTYDWTAVTQRYAESGLEIPIELRRKFAAEADLERAMIEGYMEWLTETGADAELDVIAPETYLEVEVTDKLLPHDRRVKLIGKLDVRTRRRRDNVRLFIDHKTVADFGRATRALPRNEQMLHYHLLEWLSTTEGEERCDAALYNMLRKVKRGVSAQPPFYQRVTVYHNTHELHSYYERVLSTVDDILLTEHALTNGHSHRRAVYPNPTNDCAWDCPFAEVCTMFDDGSRVDAALAQYYRPGDTLSYYTEDTSLRGLTHAAESTRREGTV